MRPKHLIIIGLTLLAAACSKPSDHGNLSMNIGYSVNGMPLVIDSLGYCNEAGNAFMVTEIQWFLSKMEFQDEQGRWVASDGIFYIDTDLPESQTLTLAPIPVGHYKTMRFTFGLDEEDNRTGLFTDPPESEMFWPDILGGGYHYMKLNGRFVGPEGGLQPLAIHLGIGQNADFTEFYHNHFTVELPIDLTIAAAAESQLELTMVVDNWFRNPHTIDFSETGSHIMQNQAAQRLFNDNGQDVFRIEKPTNMENDKKLAEKFRNTIHLATPKPQFWSWKNVKETVSDLASLRVTARHEAV